MSEHSSAQDTTSHPAIRITDPAQIPGLIPWLLGFHPDNSLIIIGIGEPGRPVRVIQRYSLSPWASAATVASGMNQAIRVLAGNELTRAVLAGYGPPELVAPYIAEFRSQARQLGIDITGVMRVENGRYWTDPGPSEGRPLGGLTPDPALAPFLAEGLSHVYGSRAELAAQVAPLTGPEAAAMRRATAKARTRLEKLLEQAPPGKRARHALLAQVGSQDVQAALQEHRSGTELKPGQAAWLTVLLQNLQVRDDTWCRLDPGQCQDNLRFLLALTPMARKGYAAAPASLLAYTAWQCGNGSLANVALDRALADNPWYSMAELLRSAILLPPSLARSPMTPEEVAAEYAKRAAEDEAKEQEEASG
jgi:hypothetical protein